MYRASTPDDIDLASWPTIPATLSDIETRTLAWHVAEQLVGAFGVERFEAYRGKEGLQLITVDDLAAVVVNSLSPVWNELRDGTVRHLSERGEIGQRLNHPWDKTT